AAPDPPPPRRPRQSARLPLSARLLPHLAPPPGLEAAPLRRRAAPPAARSRRESAPLRTSRAQGTDEAHSDRRAMPLAPNAALRTRDPHPQHDPPPGKWRDLRSAHNADRNAGARARADRRLHAPDVVTTQPGNIGPKPGEKPQSACQLRGTSD